LAISKASPDIKRQNEVKINAVGAEFFAFRLTNVNIGTSFGRRIKSAHADYSGTRTNVSLAYNGGGKSTFEFEENIISTT
jgi:hypothetical protein